MERDYLSKILPRIYIKNKKEILEPLASGKCVILYEKNKNLENLDMEIFFEKSEFFSKLKNHAICNLEYEDAKFLYKKFQMRNLSDMNNLYNVQCDLALQDI